MPFVRYRETDLYYTEKGKGRVVVLLHGFLENHTLWDATEAKLAESYRVIRMDLPGHGNSGNLGYTHSMEDMAGAVKAVLYSLQIRRSVMVGHSMGGYTALAFAELFPKELRGIILLHSTPAADTPERMQDRIKAMRVAEKNKDRYLAETGNHLFYPTFPQKKECLEGFYKMAQKTSLQGIVAALEGMRTRPDRTELLGNFDGRKFILFGKYDKLISPQKLKEISLKHPQIILRELKKSAHMSMFEEPENYLKMLQTCIRRSYAKQTL